MDRVTSPPNPEPAAANYSMKCKSQYCLKAEAEASTLALVPKRRLEDLELGLGRDVEPPHSSEWFEGGSEALRGSQTTPCKAPHSS